MPEDELLLEELLLLELLLDELLLELLLDELLLELEVLPLAPIEPLDDELLELLVLEEELLELEDELLVVLPPQAKRKSDISEAANSFPLTANFALTAKRLLLLDDMLISRYFRNGASRMFCKVPSNLPCGLTILRNTSQKSWYLSSFRAVDPARTSNIGSGSNNSRSVQLGNGLSEWHLRGR